MKLRALAILIALTGLFFSCSKDAATNKLTGKDWTIKYLNDDQEPEYVVYRFYPDHHMVIFDLQREDDPDKQDIIIDNLGYDVDYTVYSWDWLDDKHTKLHISKDLNYITIEKTYIVEKLGYSELILKKIDSPNSLMFEKNNKIFKDTKYEYDTFYNNVVNP